MPLPKGLTLIDDSQAPSGAQPSSVKLPKGLTLIDGGAPAEKAAPVAAAQEPKPVVPAGLKLVPKPTGSISAAPSTWWDRLKDTFREGYVGRNLGFGPSFSREEHEAYDRMTTAQQVAYTEAQKKGDAAVQGKGSGWEQMKAFVGGGEDTTLTHPTETGALDLTKLMTPEQQKNNPNTHRFLDVLSRVTSPESAKSQLEFIVGAELASPIVGYGLKATKIGSALDAAFGKTGEKLASLGLKRLGGMVGSMTGEGTVLTAAMLGPQVKGLGTSALAATMHGSESDPQHVEGAWGDILGNITVLAGMGAAMHGLGREGGTTGELNRASNEQFGVRFSELPDDKKVDVLWKSFRDVAAKDNPKLLKRIDLEERALRQSAGGKDTAAFLDQQLAEGKISQQEYEGQKEAFDRQVRTRATQRALAKSVEQMNARAAIRAERAKAKELGEQYKKQAETGTREVKLSNTQQTSEGREQAAKAVEDYRSELEKTAAAPPPIHSIEQIEGGGYGATYKGDRNIFTIDPHEGGYGVTREIQSAGEPLLQTLNPDGHFDQDGEVYLAPNPETADAVARITAVSRNLENAISSGVATPDEIDQDERLRDTLGRVMQGLVEPTEALRDSGIPFEMEEPPSYVQAAINGNLPGPLNEKTGGEFAAELGDESDKAPIYIRAATEAVLHFIHASGDWITGKDGRTWVLDEKGLMHPGDGGTPFPLMKDGRYTNQAIQIAESGKIGNGVLSREAARVEAEKNAKTDRLLEEYGPQIEQGFILAEQNKGLIILPEPPVEESGAIPPPPDDDDHGGGGGTYDERYEPDRARQAENLETLSKAEEIAAQIEQTQPDLWAQIKGIADQTGKTTNEVIGRWLFKKANISTPEGKAAQLQPGDRIQSGNAAYTVGEVKGRPNLRTLMYNGKNFYTFDPNRPTPEVLRIIRNGEVSWNSHTLTDEDLRSVIHETPVVATRNARVQAVEDVASGKTPASQPRTDAQKRAAERAAKENEVAATSVATEAAVEATNATADTTDQQINDRVDKAKKTQATAQKAKAQSAAAKGRAAGLGEFPRRKPITAKGVKGREGFVGGNGIIAQGDRTIPFHYELLRRDATIGSHVWDGRRLVKNPDYQPAEMQTRTYAPDEEEANYERAGLDSYRSGDYLQDTNGPERGPSIIEPGGRKVGGNTRDAIRAKYLDNVEHIADPDQRQSWMAIFNDETRRFARSMGITEFPDDGHIYDVYRVLDEPIDTVGKAVELANLFNESTTVRLNENVAAVTNARLLTEADETARKAGEKGILEKVAEMIADTDTVKAAIDKFPKFFADLVRNHLHIPRSESQDWFENSDQGQILSGKGKNKLELALIATVIKDTETLQNLSPSNFAALGKAVGSISKLRAFPEQDISDFVNQAVAAAAEVHIAQQGEGSLTERWNRTYHQDSLFLDEDPAHRKPDEPNRLVRAIWLAINDPQTTRLNRALKDMVGGLVPGMDNLIPIAVEGKILQTPADRFNNAFAKEAGAVEKIGGKPYPITQAEFDAAVAHQPFTDEQIKEANGEKVAAKSKVVKGGSGKSPEPAWEGIAPPSDDSWNGIKEGVKVVWEDGDGKEQSGTVIDMRESRTYKGLAEIKRADGSTELVRLGDLGIQGGAEAPPKAPASIKAIPAPPEPIVGRGADGYATTQTLRKFLYEHPATKANAAEILSTAQIIARSYWDAEEVKPEGVARKNALDWMLKKVGFRGAEAGNLRDSRGEYNFATGIMKLHKLADASTFMHEFMHVIAPMLSEQEWEAIDSIIVDKVAYKREFGREWDYTGMDERREKLSYGGEKFFRDENAVDFKANVEAKAVLQKIKRMFISAYSAMVGRDPLSPFKLSEEAKEWFTDHLGIEGLDLPDEWKSKYADALRKEGRIGKPEEAPSPLEVLGKQIGATEFRGSYVGGVPLRDEYGTVSGGLAVKPTNAVFAVFPSKGDALAATATIDQDIEADKGKIKGYDVWTNEDGTAAIRFNKEGLKASNVLHQMIPQDHAMVRLRELEEKEKKERNPFLRELWRKQIANVRNEIQSDPRINVVEKDKEDLTEAAMAARKGVKNARTEDRGRIPTGVSTPPERGSARESAERAFMGLPRHADAGEGTRRAGGQEAGTLKGVTPVNLQPLQNERGEPVGSVAGEGFDSKFWSSELRKAGLPKNLPPPTEPLSRESADKLIFPGQRINAQTARSALKQGDGFLLASVAGSGKTYVSLAVVNETLRDDPDSKILYITKNQTLLADDKKSIVNTAKNSFGFNVEIEEPDADGSKGVYGTTYAGLRDSNGKLKAAYRNVKWDLVVADESGEARNWYQEQPKGKIHQGQLLKDVVAQSKKAMYVSATPFHTPMEYGYLDKLNLWPKGGFNDWVKENFKHKIVNGRVVGEVDPGKQIKLREQLIERGQMSSQTISYEGFNAHFGIVPVTRRMEIDLSDIHDGITAARQKLIRDGRENLANKLSAFEATYTKAYLERARIGEAIQLARQAREQGYRVAFYAETTADDLFRRERDADGEVSKYQELDDQMGGQLSKIMPPFENVFERLRSEFGDEIGNYSGYDNTLARRGGDKDAFMSGDKPMLYTTYAAGGIGLSLHDEVGDKPTVAIFLGPPYSGVMLEHALARFWRLGVKSNVHVVILATDSEPDIRMLSTKVGPRLRAVNAAVYGENDSLGTVMGGYSEEEKLREYQDMLAYDQGNEVKIDALSAQKKSKTRNVNVDNWGAITFPPAAQEMHKGMQVQSSVPLDGDWTTLYQRMYGMGEPPKPEDVKTDKAINEAANEAAKNPDIPKATIGASANLAKEVADNAPDGIDKAAAGKQVFEGEINTEGWFQDPETGQFTAAHRMVRQMREEMPDVDERDLHHYTIPTVGMNEETRMIAAGRKIGAESEVRDVYNTIEGQAQAESGYENKFGDEAYRVFKDAGVKLHDKVDFRAVVDALEGNRTAETPEIAKAAEGLSALMVKIKNLFGDKGVWFLIKEGPYKGERGYYKNVPDNPNQFPHIMDWDAKVTDPDTGSTKTVEQIMGNKFDDAQRLKYMEAKRRELNAPEYTTDSESGERLKTAQQWLNELKREKKRVKNRKNSNVMERRKVNHPFYHKDYWALESYFRQAANVLSVHENFGLDMSKIKPKIAKVPSEKMRTDMIDTLAQMFEYKDWDTLMGQVVRKGQQLEVATKLPLAVIKVAFHGAHIRMGLHGRVMPILKTGLKLARNPNEFMREAYFTGVVGRRMNPWLLEGGERGIAGMTFQLTGFNGLYRLQKAFAGQTAKTYMVQDALPRLIKYDRLRREAMEGKSPTAKVSISFKEEDEIKRIVQNNMLIGDQEIAQAIADGKWSDDSLEKAQRAFADRTLYSQKNSAQMPMMQHQSMAANLGSVQKNWNAALRASYSLQSFAVKTYSLERENFYNEVFQHGNLRPLIPFFIDYPAAGAAMLLLGAGVTHAVHRDIEKVFHEKHEPDKWDALMAQFSDFKKHPWAGPFKFYIDSLTTMLALERTKRYADLAFDIAMGHRKPAQVTWEYLYPDELEMLVGPIHAEAGNLAKNAAVTGERMTYPPKHTTRPEIAKEESGKELEYVLPLTKNIPPVDRIAHPPKKKAVKIYKSK